MHCKHGEAGVNCRNDDQLTTGREREREIQLNCSNGSTTATSCSVNRSGGHVGHKINQKSEGHLQHPNTNTVETKKINNTPTPVFKKDEGKPPSSVVQPITQKLERSSSNSPLAPPKNQYPPIQSKLHGSDSIDVMRGKEKPGQSHERPPRCSVERKTPRRHARCASTHNSSSWFCDCAAGAGGWDPRLSPNEIPPGVLDSLVLEAPRTSVILLDDSAIRRRREFSSACETLARCFFSGLPRNPSGRSPGT